MLHLWLLLYSTSLKFLEINASGSVVNQTQLIVDDSSKTKNGSQLVMVKSHLAGGKFELLTVPEERPEESFQLSVPPEVESGNVSLAVDQGVRIGKLLWSDAQLENLQEPVRQSWATTVKPEEPVKSSWKMAVKPEAPMKQSFTVDPRAAGPGAAGPGAAGLGAAGPGVVGPGAAGPGEPWEVPEMPVAPGPTIKSYIPLYAVLNCKSVFSNWETLFNLALEYNQDRIVPFVLYICLSEAQKYGSDLASAKAVLMECRRGIVFRVKKRKRGDEWDSIFTNPHNIAGGFVDPHRPGGFVDFYQGDEDDNPAESSEAVSIDAVTMQTTLISGNKGNITVTVKGGSDGQNASYNNTLQDIGVGDSKVKAEEDSLVCYIHSGSFQQMPSLRVCFKRKHKYLSCTVNSNTKRVLSNQSCKQKFRSIVFRKLSWILLKVNFALDCNICMLLAIPWVRNKLNRNSLRTRENNVLLSILLMWLLCRLQETSQADIDWMKYVPYLCNVTNTVRYVLEAVMLYTAWCTSLRRYRAVANPIRYRVHHQTGFTQNHAAVIGLVIGLLCSVINIIAVHLMSADESTGALCRLTTVPHEEGLYLEGMIAIKSISLTIMYVVPCICILITNASMAIMLPKQQRRSARTLTRSYSARCTMTKRKNKQTVCFILISSLCMMLCLPQPILDLSMAVTMHNNMQATYEHYISMFLNSLLINCTTLAYSFKTFVSVYF